MGSIYIYIYIKLRVLHGIPILQALYLSELHSDFFLDTCDFNLDPGVTTTLALIPACLIYSGDCLIHVGYL